MTAMMAYNSFSRWSSALGICAIVAVIRPAHADPRAVVELFTSQGCSSCPPADKIIGDLAKDPNVIALSMPIDYWDYLGWKDTLADSRFSARQKAYSHMRGDRDVYTPQAVINGSAHVIGSDRASIESAIRDTEKGGSVIEGPWDGEEAITLMADLDAGATGAMTGGGYPDGIRQIIDPYFEGRREAAKAAYERWLPLINYENRQCGLSACKVLMREGGVIKSDMVRHPLQPLHPATRAGLIEIARTLDPVVLRWGR